MYARRAAPTAVMGASRQTPSRTGIQQQKVRMVKRLVVEWIGKAGRKMSSENETFTTTTILYMCHCTEDQLCQMLASCTMPWLAMCYHLVVLGIVLDGWSALFGGAKSAVRRIA